MRTVFWMWAGLALAACGGGASEGGAPAAPTVVVGPAAANAVAPAGPGVLEEHRLRRVQQLREDRAAAEAHAAAAVAQAAPVTPREPLPAGTPTVKAAAVAAGRAQGANLLLVDPRAGVAFLRAHAEGAAHVPAAELALRPLPEGARVVLIGDAGDPAVAQAARALGERGAPFAVVEGGLPAWQAAGLPVVRLAEEAGPAAAVARVAADALPPGADLLDVRPADAWASGHVPGSRSVPAATLADAPLPEGAVVVVAADDAAAEGAARVLLQRGAPRVQVLEGGVPAWVRAGGRLAVARRAEPEGAWRQP